MVEKILEAPFIAADIRALYGKRRCEKKHLILSVAKLLQQKFAQWRINFEKLPKENIALPKSSPNSRITRSKILA